MVDAPFPLPAHRTGSVEQEAHLVTPPRPTSPVPISGLSALLELVEWCHARRRSGPQGGSSCVDPEPSLSPPAPDRSSWPPGPAPVLADVDHRILGTLSRIAAQQLAGPPAIPEATHERS